MPPKISLIVLTYFPHLKDYLDLCIRSLRELDYPKERMEILLVARKSYLPQYEGVRTLCPPLEEPFPGTPAVNWAIRQIASDSDHILFLNDDVIMTRSSLRNLVRQTHGRRLISTGISPCQDGLDHSLSYSFTDEEGRKFRMLPGSSRINSTVMENLPSLLKAESNYPTGFYYLSHLCMFCVLIPRNVWEEIGPFDEHLQGVADDIDWSWRCERAGVRMITVLDSLIWHFSSVSLDGDKVGDRRRYLPWVYFKRKWGKFPPYVSTERFLRAKEAHLLEESR